MPDLFAGLESPQAPRMNRLFYGDNLTIMQGMPNACVDLIYLDPPFNSQRSYNLIYKQLTGLPLPEQEEAFCDAWELDPEKEEMARRMPVVLREHGADELVQFWTAWINALRTTQPRLLAYLVYMTYRLFQMRRILKSTGSIYLHCDPAASHYIKVMMDGVFGHGNFRNEIVWKRTFAHGGSARWGDVHDSLLFYTKSEEYTWNRVLQAHDEDYVAGKYRFSDERGKYRLVVLTGPGTRDGASGQPWRGYNPTDAGRHWAVPKRAIAALHAEGFAIPTGVHEQLDFLYSQGFIRFPQKSDGRQGVPEFKLHLPAGQPIQDVVTDVPPINSQAKERLGYPTQKPIALLDRIIQASSNPGDVVFDPFCGCGTTICSAQKNGRHWIGCDIAILSVRIVRDVLTKRYGLVEDEHYEISGIPLSVEGAVDLFERDKRQFQHWLVEMSGGFCNSRYSGDQGVDGRIYFETKPGLKNMVLSVKGGHLAPAYVRELRGTMAADPTTELAGFLCLEKPTRGMTQEAAKAGMFTYLGKDYPRIQIRTVEDLLQGRGFETPTRVQTLGWEKQTRLAI